MSTSTFPRVHVSTWLSPNSVLRWRWEARVEHSPGGLTSCVIRPPTHHTHYRTRASARNGATRTLNDLGLKVTGWSDEEPLAHS